MQSQNFAMQQQMFQQQMRMQMAAMEKGAETIEKFLCCTAKSIASGRDKRKRGGTDRENSLSNEDKCCN